MTEITPEVQAQLDSQKAECPFCKIISGEIESKKVYSDNFLSAVLDINPWTNGHVILMPKEHYPILPLLPPTTFKHMFSILPKLSGAVKESMLCTSVNIFIANGGVAGQQSPHFLLHILPRENGDKINEFSLDSNQVIDESKSKQTNAMLKNNFSLMMQKHYARNPASWTNAEFKRADFISDELIEEVLYEDKKLLVAIPKNQQCIGHIVIYLQEEEKHFENVSEDSSFHLFSAASLAGTAVFEGMQAHGSNIILKSGTCNDNPYSILSIHILPRYSEDGLNIVPKPIEDKKDLDEISKNIKDKTFIIEHSTQQKKEEKVIDWDEKRKSAPSEDSHEDEITKAIRNMH